MDDVNALDHLSFSTRTKLANEMVGLVKYFIRTGFKNGTGKSQNGVFPLVKDNKLGIGVLDEYEYLVFQNRGFETFVMKELKGKVIPMMINGKLVFRRATRINQFDGRRGLYVRRVNGELEINNEPRRRWVHPGLMPKNFIEDAQIKVIERHKGEIMKEAAESWRNNSIE